MKLVSKVTAAVCFGALLVTTACGESEDSGNADNADSDELLIGAAVALTGSIAPYDQPIMNGFELGVDEINDAGGIGGTTKIRYLVRDTKTDTQTLVQTVQELIDEGVDVLVLECYGEQALGAAAIIQQAEIPAVTTCASQPETQDAGGEYYFGNIFGDNSQAVVSAQYAAEEGYQNAFLLVSSDSLFTQKTPQYFGQVFEASGGTVVGSAEFSLGDQDFSAAITKIENLDPLPDVIMTAAYEPDFPAFMRQLRSAGLDIPVIGADGLDTPTTLQIGESIEGLVFSSIGIPTEEFVSAYREKFGSDPESHYTPVGVDLARVVAAAVEAAGSTDPQEIRDAWAELENVEGETGSITYAGTNRTPIKQVSLVEIQDGNFVTIKKEIPDPDDIPPHK